MVAVGVSPAEGHDGLRGRRPCERSQFGNANDYTVFRAARTSLNRRQRPANKGFSRLICGSDAKRGYNLTEPESRCPGDGAGP
jgi:hypothetical protein